MMAPARPASPSRGASEYREAGYAVVPLYSRESIAAIGAFAEGWVRGILAPWMQGPGGERSLTHYHAWSHLVGDAHRSLFGASNRHCVPPPEVGRLLLGEGLGAFLSALGIERYRVWDEGLGWLGFRFIRPGMGDGYPFSRKAWGPAEKAISCWVPVLGRSPKETLALVPGSHLREYGSELRPEAGFRRDERYLATPPAEQEVVRPAMDEGEAILFHPRTLHSEDVQEGSITRLSLEFRIEPL